MKFREKLRLAWHQLSLRHPRKALRDIPKLNGFIRDLDLFRKLLTQESDQKILLSPILNDKDDSSGNLTFHYFYQDLWMAQQIYADKPQNLVDVGSRVDGFIAHIATFRTLDILDIRELTPKISNVTFRKFDIMGDVSELTDSTDAISSLHVIEHLGLGRYGDPIDPDGHIKGLNNISQILRKNGRFYFSVPFGTPRIEFNAHRVFSLAWLLDYLTQHYTIERFAMVDGSNRLVESIELTPEVISNNADQRFGCALFVLRKN